MLTYMCWMARSCLNAQTTYDLGEPKLSLDEVEFQIEFRDDVLSLSLPRIGDEAEPGALIAARSLLLQLDAFEQQALEFLHSMPGWPHGDDARLWLVMVTAIDARFCFQQFAVNDEQVVGFAADDRTWRLTGLDPRWRGP